MKELPQAPEKTTRRGFTKTIATALVAVPVVSSLTSCAQKPKVGEPGATPTPTPTPTSVPSPGKEDRGINPPVIIDGGSFTVTAPGVLEEIDDSNAPPKQYDHKYHQKNAGAFGPIKGIRIIDDYSYDVLPEYTLGSGETLQVEIWIAKVKTKTGDDEKDTDAAEYDGLSAEPNIILQGGQFEIRIDSTLSDKDKKLYKRKGKNQKKYHVNQWGGAFGKSFRIARIRVLVNQVEKYDSQNYPNVEENGFRIYLFV